MNLLYDRLRVLHDNDYKISVHWKNDVRITELDNAIRITGGEDGFILSGKQSQVLVDEISTGCDFGAHDQSKSIQALIQRGWRLLEYWVEDSTGSMFVVSQNRKTLPPVTEGLELSASSYLKKESCQWVLHAPQRGVEIKLLSPPSSDSITEDSDLAFILRTLGFYGEISTGLEWHEQVFEERSRMGFKGGYGATYRRADTPEMPSAWVPADGVEVGGDVETALSLYENEMLDVLEKRHSSRSVYGAVKLGTLQKLLNFVVGDRVLSGIENSRYNPVGRIYPSGGGVHELSVGLVINNVDGLSPGVYWFNSSTCQLLHLAAWTEQTESISKAYMGAIGGNDCPAVMGVVFSDISRLAWKYEAIAYATSLKNAGSLIACLNVAANALGLNFCAVGGGETASTKAAFSAPSDVWPVAEFVLGANK